MPNGSEYGQHGNGTTTAQDAELNRIEAEMRTILREADPEASDVINIKAHDQQAIMDERTFIRRFGFDWPEHDRIAVLELKHRLDLTDREIRLLKWTGNLRRKNGTVTVTSTRGTAIYGRCLIAVMGIEFAFVTLAEAAAVHHTLSALQALKLYAVAAIVLVVAWVIYQGYVRPWIIRQRTNTASNPDSIRIESTREPHRM